MSITNVSVSTYGSAASSATHDIPYPTPLAAGHFLVFAVSNNGIGEPPDTPAGWATAISTIPGTDRNATVFYRVADGTEGANQTVTWQHAVQAQGGIISYLGVDSTSPMDVVPVGVNLGDVDTKTAPGLGPATSETMIIHIYVSGGGGLTWTPSATMTEQYQVSATSASRRIMYTDKQGPNWGVFSGDETATLSPATSAIVQSLALRATVVSGAGKVEYIYQEGI